MNPIEIQKSLIDRLYWLVRESAPENAEDVCCRFDYSRSRDGSISVNERFSYVLEGQRVSALLNLLDEKENRPITIVPQLHHLMKEHTGGNWTAFTLEITEDGNVNTKFEYASDPTNPTVSAR